MSNNDLYNDLNGFGLFLVMSNIIDFFFLMTDLKVKWNYLKFDFSTIPYGIRNNLNISFVYKTVSD